MLISDILKSSAPINIPYATEMLRYVDVAGNRPLYKVLPSTYGDVSKVKVRQQKPAKATLAAQLINKAFEEHYVNLTQRSCYSYPSPPPVHENQDLFYVFPADGYKYLYCMEVTDSHGDLGETIDALIEQVSVSAALDITVDLVRYTYKTTNLYEGISRGAEVVFYNIPCYYAIRASLVPDYTTLIERLKK